MNERAQTLVRSAGLNENPVTALERGDSIFVLTPQTLLYQDAAGTRRVTLRDLTRIHSDQDGQLRVETPAGTALTASLLGYDPVAVQTFFAQVRDATAAVKQAQTAPAPAPIAAPAPAPMPAPQPAPRPAAAPMPSPVPSPAPIAAPPMPAPTPGHDSVMVARTAPQPAAAQMPAQQMPAQSMPAQPMPGVPLRPVQVPTPGVREIREAASQPAAPQATPTQPTSAQPAAPRPMPVFQPAPQPVPQAQPTPAPIPQPKAPAKAEVRTETRPAPAEALPSLVTPVEIPAGDADATTSTAAPLGALAGRASQVGAWVGRLRFLSVVMLLAAFALAFLQFRSGLGLNAVWVLIAGGMAAVALYALADLTRLLVGIAQNLSDQRNDL